MNSALRYLYRGLLGQGAGVALELELGLGFSKNGLAEIKTLSTRLSQRSQQSLHRNPPWATQTALATLAFLPSISAVSTSPRIISSATLQKEYSKTPAMFSTGLSANAIRTSSMENMTRGRKGCGLRAQAILCRGQGL